MSEVDQDLKDKFREELDDFEAAWGVLQLRAGLRVEKLHSAITQIEAFIFSHLNPLLEWIGEVEEIVSSSRPVAGDLVSLEAFREKLTVRDPKPVLVFGLSSCFSFLISINVCARGILS